MLQQLPHELQESYQRLPEELQRRLDTLLPDTLIGVLRELDKLHRMVEQGGRGGEKEIIKVGELTIDLLSYQVMLDGSVLNLPPLEIKLLAFLAQNRGRAFTREQLLERVWGYDYVGDAKTVDVHIRWLRKKIEKDPSRPSHLITVRGIGYKFE
jgi:DNA-binding response OmpR family regulator